MRKFKVRVFVHCAKYDGHCIRVAIKNYRSNILTFSRLFPDIYMNFPDFSNVRAPQAKILKSQDLSKSGIYRQIFFKFPDFFRFFRTLSVFFRISSSFPDYFRFFLIFLTFSGCGNPVQSHYMWDPHTFPRVLMK